MCDQDPVDTIVFVMPMSHSFVCFCSIVVTGFQSKYKAVGCVKGWQYGEDV